MLYKALQQRDDRVEITWYIRNRNRPDGAGAARSVAVPLCQLRTMIILESLVKNMLSSEEVQ